MKYIEDFLREFYKIEPLGNVKTELYESECGVYSGEELIIDNQHTNIIIYYIDYIQWLEKKL
jgi:hypothetical protein